MSQLTTMRPTGQLPHTPPSVRRRRRRFLRQPVEQTTLVVLAALILIPFVWFVSVAFRPADQLYQLVPTRFTLDNFTQMLDRVPEMGSYYLVSVAITFGSVIPKTLFATMAGFAFARLRFPGRDLLFWLIIATIFVPHITAVAALWLELFEFGLLDTYTGLILIYISWGLATSTFIMRNVFRQIPIELEQAARVDGASTWYVLWRIYTPLAKGGLIVISMMGFIHIWGEFLFAFTFAGNDIIPMSLGIRFFMPNASDPTYTFNTAAAAALFMFIPPLVIYIIFQRWLSKGLMEGALKG